MLEQQGIYVLYEAPTLEKAANLSFQLSKKKPLSKSGFGFSIYHSVKDLPNDWSAAAPAHNSFLHTAYLTAIETSPPKGMRFCYLIFYKNDTPLGVAYCQISPFSVGESVMTDDENDKKYPCLVRAFGRIVRNFVAGKNRNLLICGNLLLTGEHGFHFPENIDKATAFDLLEEALIITQTDLEARNTNIDGIFIKDIAESHRAPVQVLIDRKFSEFTFHPNMVLNLRENWLSFDDYMNDISSKYKVRARKAFKCLDGIEKAKLTENQIFSHQERLHELYKSVVDNQDFNMVALNENYMPNLKRQLGDKFNIFGYFLDGKLIGYYTTIENHDELEAHFLGFEPGLNREHHIYHNMLFDILKMGIEMKVKSVVYARTAMEIKSTLGAEAHQMLCYIRANNRLTNKVLGPIVDYLKPSTDWVPRNPFKD
jgi:predicted N-acyltransferase